MRLKYKNDLFIAEDTSLFDNDILRKAGFAYNRTNRTWLTPFASVAAKVAYNIDNCVKDALKKKIVLEKARYAASLAETSSIKVPAPKGLVYKPFQLAGIEYMLYPGDVLVADDVGLGKTIETVGYINLFPKHTLDNILIITIASMKLVWLRELTKWLVEKRSIGVARGSVWPDTDIVIINYDILKKHDANIHGKVWDLQVLDEIQYAKNKKAARSRQITGYAGRDEKVKPLIATKTIALTGSPILNKPIELYNIANYLCPYAFPNQYNYAMRYCGAEHTKWGLNKDGASNLSELQYKLRSTFMVRREKKNVLKDLPPKVRQIIEIDPDKKCLRVLKKEKGFLAAIGCGGDVMTEDEYREAVHRLSGIKVGFEEMAAVRKENAILKTPLCFNHIANAIENSGKVVVFFWHKEVGRMLLEKFKDDAVIVVGETELTRRQAAIDRFQKDPCARLFLGNIKAAGVGLTLTASSHVIFLEFTWVPGDVIQAEGRVDRIGQVNSILVQHLVLSGSIDATMVRRMVMKQKIIEEAVNAWRPPEKAINGEDFLC